MAAHPGSTTDIVLLRQWQDHHTLSTVSVQKAFLPLGKSVLPVVLVKSTEACNAINANVHHDGILQLAWRGHRSGRTSLPWISHVWSVAFRTCPSQCCPCPHSVYRWLPPFWSPRIHQPHLSHPCCHAILWQITITASWWWNWPLRGGGGSLSSSL